MIVNRLRFSTLLISRSDAVAQKKKEKRTRSRHRRRKILIHPRMQERSTGAGTRELGAGVRMRVRTRGGVIQPCSFSLTETIKARDQRRVAVTIHVILIHTYMYRNICVHGHMCTRYNLLDSGPGYWLRSSDIYVRILGRGGGGRARLLQ